VQGLYAPAVTIFIRLFITYPRRSGLPRAEVSIPELIRIHASSSGQFEIRPDWRLVESPRKTLHIEGMKKSTNAPVMTARELKDGSGWYVLFEWPNGRTRQMDGFQSEMEAETWIQEESEVWLAKSHPENRDA
jgi:hypothetical protein